MFRLLYHCFCSLFFFGVSVVFLWFSRFFHWFSVVFGGILIQKSKSTGQHYKFQRVATWNHSIAIQSAYIGVKNGMLSSLRAACFPPEGYAKNSKQKNNSFEAHMQEKMQFTAYLRGFTNTQPPRHLKGFLFLSKLSLISFPIEDGKLKKTGPKVPAKKVT